MRWLGFFSLLVAVSCFAPGCGKEVRTSFEGVYCSHVDEDPMYECSKMYDFVCITTDRHVNQTTGELGPQRYLCRLPCQPGQSCPDQGVCCPGMVYNADPKITHACVPFSFCANPPPTMRRDGAASDAREAGTGTDAGTADGGTDAIGDDAPAAADGAADVPADMELGDATAG